MCVYGEKEEHEESLYVHIFGPLNKVEYIFFWTIIAHRIQKYAISRMVIYCYCAAFNSIEGVVDRSLNIVFVLYI